MPMYCPNCKKWINNYNSCEKCGYDVREKNHYTQISRIGNLFRLYYYKKYEIENIKIYKDGKILFETKHGWFEHHYSSDKSTDVTTIYLKDKVKRSTKLNLQRKDNFIIKEQASIGFEQKSYTLYIHESNANISELPETIDWETDTEKHFVIPYILNIPHNRMVYQKENNELTNDIRFSIIEHKYSRREKTPFGKKVDEMKKKLEEHIYNIGTFETANLLKHYDIIPKKTEKEKRKIISKIEDDILEVANLKNDVTTSDLQGISMAKAKEIYNLLTIY